MPWGVHAPHIAARCELCQAGCGLHNFAGDHADVSCSLLHSTILGHQAHFTIIFTLVNSTNDCLHQRPEGSQLLPQHAPLCTSFSGA